MFVQVEDTPNPNSLKFLPGKDVLPGTTMEFPNAMSALKNSPLAEAIFKIEGIKSVFFGSNFITVTKMDDETEWKILKPEIFASIMDFYGTGLPVMRENAQASDVDINEEAAENESVSMILELLETRIRP